MVKTRRRIETEQDHFGGFNKQPVSRLSELETDFAEETPRITFSSRRNPELAVEKTRPEVVSYSSRTQAIEKAFPASETYEIPAVETRRAPKQARRQKEDFMPTVKTLAYNDRETEVDAPKKSASAKSGSKHKAMLVLYLAVATVLAIAVIAMGIALSGIHAETAALENQIQMRNETLLKQQADINHYTDLDTIAGEAQNDLDMKKIENAVGVTLPKMSKPRVYESRTNWFDRFCDWLSVFIGG